MRIGLCGSLETLQELSAAPGVDYYESMVASVLCPREDDSAFERKLAAVRSLPLRLEAVNCLLPGDLKTTGPEVDASAVDAHMAVVVARAWKLALEVIVYGSGGSRRVPEGFSRDEAAGQIVGHLRRWGPMAAQAGVTIVLEPLNLRECNIVTTVTEAAELARRAEHPNIRALADTYHMATDGDPPEAIRRAGAMIAHAHCAEGDGRGPIGTVGEDHRPYFRALKGIGYDGRVTIEAKWRDLPAELPGATAELRKQIETA